VLRNPTIVRAKLYHKKKKEIYLFMVIIEFMIRKTKLMLIIKPFICS